MITVKQHPLHRAGRALGERLRRSFLRFAVGVHAQQQPTPGPLVYLFECSECGGDVLGGGDAPTCKRCGLVF